MLPSAAGRSEDARVVLPFPLVDHRVDVANRLRCKQLNQNRSLVSSRFALPLSHTQTQSAKRITMETQ